VWIQSSVLRAQKIRGAKPSTCGWTANLYKFVKCFFWYHVNLQYLVPKAHSTLYLWKCVENYVKHTGTFNQQCVIVSWVWKFLNQIDVVHVDHFHAKWNRSKKLKIKYSWDNFWFHHSCEHPNRTVETCLMLGAWPSFGNLVPDSQPFRVPKNVFFFW